jgi:hypothetical protein
LLKVALKHPPKNINTFFNRTKFWNFIKPTWW